MSGVEKRSFWSNPVQQRSCAPDSELCKIDKQSDLHLTENLIFSITLQV